VGTLGPLRKVASHSGGAGLHHKRTQKRGVMWGTKWGLRTLTGTENVSREVHIGCGKGNNGEKKNSNT